MKRSDAESHNSVAGSPAVWIASGKTEATTAAVQRDTDVDAILCRLQESVKEVAFV